MLSIPQLLTVPELTRKGSKTLECKVRPNLMEVGVSNQVNLISKTLANT